jgi:hypothetical protein
MGRRLPANTKRTSVLRRVPTFSSNRYVALPGLEGRVCAFRVAPRCRPLLVEAPSGRTMTLVGGDVFLGTPGYRLTSRLAGRIPRGGLVPGNTYWLLAESGVVGDLVGDTPHAETFLGQAKYLGTIADDDGQIITIQQFAETISPHQSDYGALVFLIVGTSPEIGKTAAGLAVLRTLLDKGHATVIALKATGTSSVTEIMNYQDYGARQVFDCVDFGMPTTHPHNRKGMDRRFDRVLDTCLSVRADAVIIECGGDMLGGNVLTFLRCLRRRRPRARVILAAADTLGALGATRILRDIGLSVDLITGPCTDTPAARQRTQALCKAPAMNLSGNESGRARQSF